MSHIIDRRPNGSGKSTVNRGRFLDRYKDRIKEAIHEHLKGKSIQDIGKSGTDVTIPKKDLNEPFFGHSNEGEWDFVRPGNKEYSKGDLVPKPEDQQGSGGASDSDELTEDDFVFALTKEEFMHFFFEGLQLPNLIKRKLTEIQEYKNKRAGYKTSGPSSTMHVGKSMCGALARRIALGSKKIRQLNELQNTVSELLSDSDKDECDAEIQDLVIKIRDLDHRLSKIAFIDPIDLRYSNHIPLPQPKTIAVMFMIMDVSGSMGEFEKSIAKQFFILLYLFLTRKYNRNRVL
jgi:uncharacterized sporulation protein YeaH/YhbH (DUF444 family)